MTRTLRLAIAALALSALPVAVLAKDREVSIGLQAAITSMDPHYHNLSPNNSMMLHMFEPLIRRDANQKPVPSLATSWRAVDDLTWEFKLRKNVRFHDGSPFTAEDVVFTLKRVPNVPNSPSSFALPVAVFHCRSAAVLGRRKPPGTRTRRLKSRKSSNTRAIWSRMRS